MDDGFRRFEGSERGWLNRYALFRAAKEQDPSPWREWKTEPRMADYRGPVLRHKIIQYFFFRQCAALKAYANPSLCAVLGHSDQRLPLAGIILCLLMLSGMAWKARMSGNNMEMVVMPPQPSRREMHLTPMQEQLMDMFTAAPDHILSKETICAALWPKKERPENTLYTFISRLKVTLKDQSGMDIVNIRGKEYQLVDSSENH